MYVHYVFVKYWKGGGQDVFKLESCSVNLLSLMRMWFFGDWLCSSLADEWGEVGLFGSVLRFPLVPRSRGHSCRTHPSRRASDNGTFPVVMRPVFQGSSRGGKDRLPMKHKSHYISFKVIHHRQFQLTSSSPSSDLYCLAISTLWAMSFFNRPHS